MTQSLYQPVHALHKESWRLTQPEPKVNLFLTKKLFISINNAGWIVLCPDVITKRTSNFSPAAKWIKLSKLLYSLPAVIQPPTPPPLLNTTLRDSLSRRKKTFFCMNFIQHCFICRPSDSTVSNPGLLRLWLWQSDALTTRLDLIHKAS